MQFRERIATILFGLAATLGSAGPGLAQSPAAADSLALEEVTVTARKREERVVDAPLSITAFSAKDIEAKGFVNLEDVARAAPGVQYSQMGGQIPGRITSAIRFRGMNVNSDSPSLQLGALFIDGVYVLGGTQSIPYDDVERIEVVKGPQSATYGRSTFGGAINYITRTPSLTKSSAQISVLTASHNEQDFSGHWEGPIIDDKLSVSVGGRYYTRGRLFTASDGGGLGEESSRSAQITLFAQPIDALKIKVRGFYGRDSDGPPTGGIVSGLRNNSCTGKTINTQDPAFPVARPNNYICGDVPELGSAISDSGGTNVIDTPTSLRPPLAVAIGNPDVLINTLVNGANPAVIDVPRITHIGLERMVKRASISANYEFAGGYQLLAQLADNSLKANWIRSFGLSPWGVWWSRDPQDSKDQSYELRVTSPQEQRFSWLAGANYYTQEFLQSGSGGDAVSLCWPVTGQPVRAAGTACVVRNPVTGAATVFANIFPNSLLQNTDRVRTLGFYGAVNFNFTDTLTGSLEGRYQKDTTKSAFLTPRSFQIEDKKFLPRAILRWKPYANTNLYGSFARGLLPGIVNTQIAQATPRELAQYQAKLPGATAVVEGDKLDMFEIGWKQGWLEGRAQTNVAIYTGKWKNQKGRSAVAIQEDCGSASHGSAANSGCPNGATGLPAANSDGTAFLNSRNANVSGSSKLSGLELEGAMRFTEHWDARVTFTYAKTEYDDFIFNFTQAIAGFTQMKGNSNARFPKVSGSLSSGFTAPLNRNDWNWYVNGDLTYFGQTNVDESNLAHCKAYTLLGVRAGVEKESMRLEGFVRNLGRTNAWASCARWTDFDANPTVGTTLQGAAVMPVNPQQVGVRVVVKF